VRSTRYACVTASPAPPAPLPRSGFVRRPSFSHCGRPGSTAENSFAHENREISKDRDSSAFSTRFAQILVPLARKYVLAVAISRASVANSRWARKFSEPTAFEQFVRKGLGPSIAVSNHENR
ncbi:hypothetical protein, partial [Qipengyuania qiaonensis]